MKFSLEWLKVLPRHRGFGRGDCRRAQPRSASRSKGSRTRPRSSPGSRVAEVLTAEPHPDADKLQVLTVSTGAGDPLQVVCGAPNARAGMKGVLGLPGAVVPANGMELRKSAIRGVESNGMMCSVRELELGDDHEGIIELPADAPVGTSVCRLSRRLPVFDVAITPNRPDCMGVYGIARDLAAAGLGTFKPFVREPVAGHLRVPGRNPHRRSRRLPGVLRPGHSRRDQRRLARLDAAAADRRGPAADLGAGRHHQLPDARLRPPGACLRPRQAERRGRRAAGHGRRTGAGAQREDLYARSRDDRDRRR